MHYSTASAGEVRGALARISGLATNGELIGLPALAGRWRCRSAAPRWTPPTPPTRSWSSTSGRNVPRTMKPRKRPSPPGYRQVVMQVVISRRVDRLTMEREKGFEPSTSTLARLHSTTELLPQRQGAFLARVAPAVKARRTGASKFGAQSRLLAEQGADLVGPAPDCRAGCPAPVRTCRQEQRHDGRVAPLRGEHKRRRLPEVHARAAPEQ